MAKRQKTTRFSIQGWDARHYRTTDAYVQAVQSLYDKATTAITRAAARGKIDPDKPFSFDMYPSVKKEMQRITEQLASRVTTVIESGSKKQWLFACAKNDGFISSIMDTSKVSKARLKKMQDRNLDALSAFQSRKVEGMNLSQRVWKYVDQYKAQMESALDVGLGEGRSADELSRDVRQNLREPNRLFRRVRDKRGNLVLSKNARAYHPGQGVYRSSYKNAMRLTRSEINMAYRESDYQRWQQLDFVVGFEIHRSNHEPLCKCDICSKLVGRYPKTFKFKGWHPQCMCYATPILMDEETFDANELGDLKAALRGTEYKHLQAKNVVSEMPKEFMEWVEQHVEAQKGWSSTPYFIRDNFVDGRLDKGLKIEMPTVNVDIIAAYQSQIAQARAMANKWGLNGSLHSLDSAVASKNIAGIQTAISDIQSTASRMESENATIRSRCLEWGVDVTELDIAIASGKSAKIMLAFDVLDKRCDEVQREYKAYMNDAQRTIKAATSMNVDSSDVQADIVAVTNDKSGWASLKAMIMQRLNDLKKKIANSSSTAIHPALKTTYTTHAEVNDTFKKINDGLTEKWFEHGDLDLRVETNPGNNGSTNLNGLLLLKADRISGVMSALGKIGQGKWGDITDVEADAMATLWHEITHNRNKPQWIGGVFQRANFCNTNMQRSYMELANEFVARKTLPEFYKILGCPATPHPQYMQSRASTGYNRMVTNYDYVIKKLGLDAKKVLDVVREHLYEKPYCDQKNGLIDGLAKGGIKDKHGKPLKKSVLNSLIKTIECTDATYSWNGTKYVTKSKEQVLDEWLANNDVI
jgi:hypothetical protein